MKYGNMGLFDIDSKMLMGINVMFIVVLFYILVFIRFFGIKWMMFLVVGIYVFFVFINYWEWYYIFVFLVVVLGMVIVFFWVFMGNYIIRMV